MSEKRAIFASKYKNKAGAEQMEDQLKYKVTTKSGKIYRASTVEHLPGFLKMKCWDGEHRVPAGDITYIKSTEVEELWEVILPVFLFVFFFSLVIFILFV